MISFKNILFVSLLLTGITIDIQASNHRRSEHARARRANKKEMKRSIWANKKGLTDQRDTRLGKIDNQTNIRLYKADKQNIEQQPGRLKRICQVIKKAGIAVAFTYASWMAYNACQK